MMAALIGQKLHTERPQLTVEELATRARQQTAEQTKNETRAVLSAGPSSSRYKEIRLIMDATEKSLEAMRECDGSGVDIVSHRRL